MTAPIFFNVVIAVAVTIGSNISSLRTIRQLDATTRNLASTSERLASGQRINRASDDAAGLAIVSSLNASTRVYTQGLRNLNDGLSALSIAADALSGLTGIVTRQRELAEQAANGVYSNRQREALDNEANALVDEFNRVIATTSFNGVKLLDNTFRDVRLQIGFGLDGSMVVGAGSALGRTIGDGTFGSQSSQILSNYPHSIALGDLNGDGAQDIVNATNTNTVTVSLANGDGSFKAAVSFATGGLNMTSARIADVNNDGKNDIVGFGGSSWISTFLGVGDGTFGASINKVTFNTSCGVVKDFDGDGILDVVGATSGGSTSLSFFRGNGDGTFQSLISSEMGTFTYNIAAADFNGDGKLDVIRGAPSVGEVWINLGLGNGSFAATRTLNASAIYASPALGDINGDGAVDIVTTSADTTARLILLNNGDGTFSSGGTYAIPTVGSTPLLSDLNGDTQLDIISGGASTFTVRLGNGNGTFGASISYSSTDLTHAYLAAGDVNNDGADDLVTAGFTTSNVGIHLGNTTRTTTIAPLNLRTQTYALQALETTDELLTALSKEQGTLGSHQSRLQSASGVLFATRENYQAAEGRIKDADVAEESAALIRHNILQQTASGVLAQANQQPQIAIRLLGVI